MYLPRYMTPRMTRGAPYHPWLLRGLNMSQWPWRQKSTYWVDETTMTATLRLAKSMTQTPVSGAQSPQWLRPIPGVSEQLSALAASVEGFAGITTCERAGDDAILRWHAAFCFPPVLGDTADEPMAVLELIRSGQHETMDVGRAVPTLPAARVE